MNYTFVTDQGWKVTEYRPFSISYAVLHTPCLSRYSPATSYGIGQPSDRDGAEPEQPATEPSLLESLTSHNLKFSYLSVDVLRQMLQDRVNIRDRNRSSLLSRISDLSGEIDGFRLVPTPENDGSRLALEKTKLDLERELGEIDERLWKDTSEIREQLIAAGKQYESTKLRTGLLAQSTPHDDNKGQDNPAFSG